MKNAIIFENGYATIATPNRIITTTHLQTDRYVRIDDGRQYPQLCVGAKQMGPTLSYYSDEQLARECNAKIYKTRAGFETAAQRIAE